MCFCQTYQAVWCASTRLTRRCGGHLLDLPGGVVGVCQTYQAVWFTSTRLTRRCGVRLPDLPGSVECWCCLDKLLVERRLQLTTNHHSAIFIPHSLMTPISKTSVNNTVNSSHWYQRLLGADLMKFTVKISITCIVAMRLSACQMIHE